MIKMFINQANTVQEHMKVCKLLGKTKNPIDEYINGSAPKDRYKFELFSV